MKKEMAGCFCPYCGSANIGLSPQGEKGIVVVCDDCETPIWSPTHGMYVDYWACPVPGENGNVTIATK